MNAESESAPHGFGEMPILFGEQNCLEAGGETLFMEMLAEESRCE